MTSFETLYQINVNDKTEKKEGLTYLSWAWAWAEVKKIYPDAKYTIKRFENNLPYVYDPNTGYMVFTDVTIDGLTHEMWLPVMDSHNRAMKNVPYEVKTKYKTIRVEPATMFDVNKTIMRCLTKNLAMFGFGLYIYAGEDLPDVDGAEDPKPQPEQIDKAIEQPRVDDKAIEKLKKLADEKGVGIDAICERYHVDTLQELTMGEWVSACRSLSKTPVKGATA